MEDLVSMFQKLEVCYNGKKVFVTGHTGFKGAWLLKILSILGADIVGYALSPYTDDDLYHLIKGDVLCKSVIGDLRDKKKLTAAVLDAQPDFIFHLAAQPLVRLSYEIPSETFEVNAIGTAHVLDAVRVLEKPCSIVLITTDKVYHNNEWEYPYRENDRLGGYDPYSASKACTELVINSYRNSFFNVEKYEIHQKAIAVGRAGNVIGGGDWSKDRLIPDIAKALMQNVDVKVRNPDAVRPWQHVLEPLFAYLLLGMNLKQAPKYFSQPYNFGPFPTDALSVRAMLQLALKSWGNGSFTEQKSAEQPHEAGLLKLDISKAIVELGWRPKMNAEEAVRETMNWYKEFSSNMLNIDRYTEMQIKKYMDA